VEGTEIPGGWRRSMQKKGGGLISRRDKGGTETIGCRREEALTKMGGAWALGGEGRVCGWGGGGGEAVTYLFKE